MPENKDFSLLLSTIHGLLGLFALEKSRALIMIKL